MKNNKEAFREYLQLEKNYSPHTVLAYWNDIVSFESFNSLHFEQHDIDQANYSQIRSWIVSLVDAHVSNVSVNRKMASLKAYYKFLLKTKQIEASPLLKHKSLKTPKKIQIPFSEKEVDAVLLFMQNPVGFEAVRDKLIVDLLYTTGMRRTELIHLKLANVNFGASTIKVLGKRNKERIIPILPVINCQFESYLKERNGLENIIDDEYFFLSKKGVKINESFVYRLINSYFSTVSEKVKRVRIYYVIRLQLIY